jgi:hypothetical protein
MKYTPIFKQSEGKFFLELKDPDTYDLIYSIPESYDSPDDAWLRLPYWLEKLTPSTWERVRFERNAKLTKSDWTQLADAPLSPEQKQAWTVYRQALRDLPSSFATPEEVVWPSSPQEQIPAWSWDQTSPPWERINE